MDFTPIGVYRDAVKAVPHLRYGLAVAGVVAIGAIILTLTENQPVTAAISFLFVLVGMYLILILANIPDLAPLVRGPATVTVWAATILFILACGLVVSALTTGHPSRLALLIGVPPGTLIRTDAIPTTQPPAADLVVRGEYTDQEEATDHGRAIEGAVEENEMESAQPAEAPQPDRTDVDPPALLEPVQQTFAIEDSSDDCGINRTETRSLCLEPDAKVLNWTGPHISSANCGSGVSNIRVAPDRPNCVLADVTLRGCGYNNFPFGIRECKGRGWIGATIVVNGEHQL